MKLIPKYLRRIISNLFIRIKYPSATIALSANVSLHSHLEGKCKISNDAVLYGDLGYGSYIGDNSIIYGSIGRFTSIAPYTKVICGRHPYTYPYVTTAPSFFSMGRQCGFTFAQNQIFEEYKYADNSNQIPVIIGSDVWIQSDVKIISGVRIGNGAIVLAGSIVTKDIPDYAIAGGIPARIIKYRYTDEDIKFLQNLQWWNKSLEWLKNNWHLLCDFDMLKQQSNL